MAECCDQYVDLVLVVVANGGHADLCEHINRVAGCGVWQDRWGSAPKPECIAGVTELVDVELERVVVREPADINGRASFDQVGTDPEPSCASKSKLRA